MTTSRSWWCSAALALSVCVAPPRLVSAQVLDPGGALSPRQREASLSRQDKATKGTTLDDFAKRLGDSDPDTRKQAVESLGGSDDPKAIDYLMQAVEDGDPRVATKALDVLGRKRATAATEFLTERLSLAGTAAPLRRRILVTLGQIGDSKAASPVLDFVRTASDPETRGTGISVLGEIADPTLRPELEKLAASEPDPELKRLIAEALTKIAARGAAPPSGSSGRAILNEGSIPKNP